MSVQTLGEGRGVPRQVERGRRMSSFLGRKLRDAFEQPVVFLGGKLHDHHHLRKSRFFKSLSLFSKTIVQQCQSFKLEKKYLISIN